MDKRCMIQRPAKGAGNTGMKTPYEQGIYSGAGGEQYENPYNQPGEETEASEYSRGWKNGASAGLAG